MAAPPAALPEPATPTATLISDATSFALTLILLAAVTTAPLLIDASTRFLSQLRLIAPPAALLPEPAPATVTLIICEPRSTLSGNTEVSMTADKSVSSALSNGKKPESTLTSPSVESTVAPAIEAFIELPTNVVPTAAPIALLPETAPPIATTTMVVLSAALTVILPVASTSVSAPRILASVVVAVSLIDNTKPAALLPEPAIPPATTTIVSRLKALTSMTVPASTSAPLLISALTKLRIKLIAIEPPIALLAEPAPPMLTLISSALPSARTSTKPFIALTVALSI